MSENPFKIVIALTCTISEFVGELGGYFMPIASFVI